MRTHLLSLAAVVVSTMPSFAMSDNDLHAALEHRFKGDRTGACVAAAVIDDGTTANAYFCADAKSARPYDEHTAFEIGSVTKTMTAALLAEFIARGEVASCLESDGCRDSCQREAGMDLKTRKEIAVRFNAYVGTLTETIRHADRNEPRPS